MVEPLNKQQLYELVWEVPMRELAGRYGLTDRGLAKLCERNGIPVPPRGYWAKKRAGAKITKPLLLVLDTEKADTVLLAHAGPKQPKQVSDEFAIPEDIQQAIDRESLPEHKVVVPKTLQNPHLIVARWIRKEELQAASYRKYGDPLYRQEPLTEIEKRRRRIISTLLKALERRGFTIEEDNSYGQFVWVVSKQDRIGFSVSERVWQKRRELTKEEKLDSWYADQKWRRYDEPSGLLRLRISTQYRGGYNVLDFQETSECPLEEQLNDIIAGFIQKLWWVKQERLRREERQQIDWQRQIDAQRQAELRKQEEERKAHLERKAADWRKAQNIRDYVLAVEEAERMGPTVDQSTFLMWKHWALKHANILDPITSRDPLI